ncbi:hypothetical protein J1614_007029 [Plenodomus biglobosus]|nr:hypothetical protein J1614_007029 [Plenodomus biglobosus]
MANFQFGHAFDQAQPSLKLHSSDEDIGDFSLWRSAVRETGYMKSYGDPANFSSNNRVRASSTSEVPMATLMKT